MSNDTKAKEMMANLFALLTFVCAVTVAFFIYTVWRSDAGFEPGPRMWIILCVAVGGAITALSLHVTMSEVARLKVAAGANLLDQHWETRWPGLINRDTLKIRSNSRCMLGQLYRDPHDGLDDLGLKGRDAYDYGFAVLFGFWKSWWLTPAWRRIIEQRLALQPSTA